MKTPEDTSAGAETQARRGRSAGMSPDEAQNTAKRQTTGMITGWGTIRTFLRVGT